MKDARRITGAFLGSYAGLLAIQHGIFEILQGGRRPHGSVLIQAIGAPCRPEEIWHACFPAMTLIPDLLASGMLVVSLGLCVLAWAVAFAAHRHGGIILVLLSILMLPVGGGFVPVFIGVVAGIAVSRIPAQGTGSRLLAKLWPGTLIAMAAWLPGSWLLGVFFGQAMLALGGALFLVFDIGLPVLAAFSSRAYTFEKE